MNVVVFGAGSLGSLVGGLLAREHSVTLVGRNPHVEEIRNSGLRVSGEFDFEVTPEATIDGTGLAAELAVVTVKAFDTESAARDLSTGNFDAVLSLQNGMGNEEILADYLDCPVLAGTATYGAVCLDPGTVECTGEGRIVLGAREGGDSETADRVGTAFRTAGFDATVAADMPRRLWKKLAVNAGINATTALGRVENGALLDGPAHEVAVEAARETARVARAEGIELDEKTAAEAVERVAEETAANTSSMHQDVLAGRRTEVGAINQYLCARAEANDVAVPTNQTLTRLLRAWERENVSEN
ncbi:ketopantoate reductase family protein [Halorussus halophilus]|uniref:ketopantoate reductase family protein n=1 Tax=Halorussus halophilus TaxID=2650975 RepID=UPI0013018022|nr:2-dehydropantoate 2-reductase [Halorussus halophilus]